MPSARSVRQSSASSKTIHGSGSTSIGAGSTKSPLPAEEQSGKSSWGTLHQATFPKWLGDTTESPWGDHTVYNSDATVKGDIPETNATRHYDFTVSRSRLSPDGVLRDVIIINDQFPGPIIETNWGDWIEITVHNKISAPEEGTALHWHGMLQRSSQWEDGTPGISQCPIAPGHSYTYRFRAELYGTSLYHAHYSAQYTGGIVGPIQIYGPSSADYNIDPGPIMLSDWNHIPYFSMVSDVVGTGLSKIPPLKNKGLINGRGRFGCSQPSLHNRTQ